MQDFLRRPGASSMTHVRRMATVGAMLGASMASLVHAQRLATIEGAAIDDARTIIVIGRAMASEAERRVATTPGGSDLVGYADYADKSVVSLRDTLTFSPGVYLQPRYGQEVRISIRGSGLSRGYHMRGLTLLQDGVPINLADDNGDFQELEPIFFDHLEVYRGANALRFGSGTLGGAINGVTPTGRTAQGLYLRGDIGSFTSVRGLVSAGVTNGRVDAWGAMSADTSDGDRDHAKRRSLRFQGNVGLSMTDAVTTRFYVSVNHIKQDLPGALTRAEALTTPRKANAGAIAGDQARDVDSLRLQNRTTLDWGTGTLDVGGFVSAKSLHHPIFQLIDQKSVDVGAFFRADHAAGPIAITLGGEVRRGSTDARQFVNIGGRRGALTFDAEQKAQTANLYGELRVRPVKSLTLIAGGVYADGWRQRHVQASATPAADGRIDFNAFSPKFGLLIEPTSAIQIFANYSRSAEFPGFSEVFQTIGTPPTNAIVSAIRPQRAWTAEVGTRGRLGALRWDVAFYRSTLNGELLQYTTNSQVPAATFNAGRTLHQGVEAGFDLMLTNWLRLRQVYAYSDFRFRGDAVYGGNHLPVVPRHLYRAELRLGTDALHIAPTVEWVPKGPFADYRNRVRAPGYALLGFTAGARVAEGFDAFVDVRNITGKTAIGDISAAIDAAIASAIYYPVERRSVSAGLRARF